MNIVSNDKIYQIVKRTSIDVEGVSLLHPSIRLHHCQEYHLSNHQLLFYLILVSSISVTSVNKPSLMILIRFLVLLREKAIMIFVI